MKTTLLRAISAFFLVLISFQSRADHLSAQYLFAARMNGAQEVPAVTTNAVGVATFFLNAHMDSLCITVTVNGLSGPITGAHIHEGATGVSGPIIKDVMAYVTGNRVQVLLTGTNISPLVLKKMFSGDYYFNVHTTANPSGEIRGQILPEEDKGIMGWLEGAQQVPPVVTNARGLGFFMLSKHQSKLSFNVVFEGLSANITGAHFHAGSAGTNGPVVQDLMSFVSGNTITGSVDPATFLNALLRDSLYINIHTTAHAGGEIRAQLRIMPYLHFDAKMDGAQEAPAVTTNAKGVAVFRLNYTMDSLWYDAMGTGLSGPITAAHIHKGAVGVSGPVLVPFPAPTITVNRISGLVALGVPIPDSIVHFLLDGSLYVNMHTAANGSGEIRGQIYRTFREGYTYILSGNQQNPPVTTGAYGSGMVSIDRDQTNAHYMMVANGLTPTAAHFHENIAGQNGPVLYDIFSNYANGGIFGYWRENDPVLPFTTAISNKFRKDSIYVNMHTTTNPSGEIRGQTSRTLCSMFPVLGIRNIGTTTIQLTLHPNPAYEYANMDMILSDDIHASVLLTDISGRTIWAKDLDLQSGANRVVIPLSGTAAGLYFVRLMDGGNQLSYKLIKY